MDNNIRLVEPSLKYREAFQNMVKQYEIYGEKEYFDMYSKALEDFHSYVIKIQNEARGINLKEGWVPCCNYWLVDKNEDILGVVRIRKELTSKFLKDIAGNIGYDIAPLQRKKGYGKIILKLGLKKSKELNVSPILVTCASSNIGSKKIIEENGGTFEKEIVDEWKKGLVRRYWFFK
ncbi:MULTISPECIES: GNAT family N-acetyltransferase [Clostridium]|uniref:GNAT family N-acetyltransferase n=1 Tax=Clostridium TaxID=1485 RepID=UPI0008262B7A|nr:MULTISPECIES: GNAT family N-acetyltransferase [Clostridium]PJI08040.1 GNAT family acetyltransferase [Clostridium sp. CT7]